MALMLECQCGPTTWGWRCSGPSRLKLVGHMELGLLYSIGPPRARAAFTGCLHSIVDKSAAAVAGAHVQQRLNMLCASACGFRRKITINYYCVLVFMCVVKSVRVLTL
jgi:hypothetical protein